MSGRHLWSCMSGAWYFSPSSLALSPEPWLRQVKCYGPSEPPFLSLCFIDCSSSGPDTEMLGFWSGLLPDNQAENSTPQFGGLHISKHPRPWLNNLSFALLLFNVFFNSAAHPQKLKATTAQKAGQKECVTLRLGFCF